MRWTAGSVLLWASLAGSAALSASASQPVPSPLLPLSDTDTYSTHETGCEFGFSQGRDTYLSVIGHSFILRTAPGAHGLNVCRISDDQFQGFGDGPTGVTCGGRTLTLRRTGRATSHEESDSAGGPAALTMTQGGHRRIVRGDWGSAC